MKVFEDPELSTLRDNELYFFEEPTFRTGVSGQVECEVHFPGSVWLTNHYGGACFIQNVPHTGVGNAAAAVGTSSYEVGFKPRGGKDLEVMFTDADWDVPRRITAIALNDDVDEPDEKRVIYFDTSSVCSTGVNHNPGTRAAVANPATAVDCIADELYNDAIIVTGTNTDTITVQIFDDDIADLVVLCGDNPGAAAADLAASDASGSSYVDDCAACSPSDCVDATVCPGCFLAADTGTCTFTWQDDENFIGSYDASHQNNRWDENTVRMGSYAEDGMSYSKFGGGLSTVADGITGQYKDYANAYESTQKKGFLQIALAAPLDGAAVVGATVAQANSAAGGTLRRATVLGESILYVDVTSGTFTDTTADAITVASLTAVAPTLLYTVPYNAGLTHTFNFGDNNDWRSCKNCGYTSIMTTETNAMNMVRCTMRSTATNKLNTLNEVVGSGDHSGEEGCYPDTVAPWVDYDPYSDTYCTAAHTAGVVETTGTCTPAITAATDIVLGAAPTVAVAPGMTVAGAGINTLVTVTVVSSDGLTITVDAAQTIADNTVLTFQATTYGPHCSGYVDETLQVRGFKGVGPAHTEAADSYVCTVHSRECHDPAVHAGGTATDDVASTTGPQAAGTTDDKDSTGGACVYGEVAVRLNSSPGTKTVRRQYAGVYTTSMDTVLETELVHIVVTPDETPQTRFFPTSVTFTHTGGVVDGKVTSRWDQPSAIQVIPKDDNIDERAGPIVDFTAFTITQSHFYDEYWLYTTPYMNMDKDYGTATAAMATGEMCVPNWDGTGPLWESCKNNPTATEVNTGRFEGHTLYRHTIRTIHTMDNDFSGVKAESPVAVDPSDRVTAAAIAQTAVADQNHYTHTAVNLATTEGGTFSYYTLELDTQPAKIQRQTGTSPNNAIVWSPDANCGDVLSASTTHSAYTGPENGDFYNDFSDATRPYVCGSVEPHSDYWVDVTVTQTIHVDLAVPASCPAGDDTKWGGGAGKTWTAATDMHPRFPFNGKWRSQHGCPYPDMTKYASNGAAEAVCSGQSFKIYEPFDELVDEPSLMDGYLTSCGGWQRDATFRFTATNWDIPQYVYIFAHNDKDAPSGASGENSIDHVVDGGNDETDSGETSRTTVLKHYVETEDVLDNYIGVKTFVQWNKFGGVYTYGNIERFPFGYSTAADADNARTDADVRYGALDETGYTTWGYSKYESLYGYGYYVDGEWSTAGCCSTAMGGTWGATTGGMDIWGTTGGYGGTDSNWLGHEFRRTMAGSLGLPSALTGDAPSPWCTFARPAASLVNGIVVPGAACVDHITGDSEPRPYVSDSASEAGAFCTPVVGRVSGSDVRGGFCVPRFATSYQTYAPTAFDTGASANDGLEFPMTVGTPDSPRGSGHALKFVPVDVTVFINDNDQIADQTNPIANCKQTQYFMWSDHTDTATDPATGIKKSKWLVDYNCDNADAGGLPGYPASAVSGSGYDIVRTGAGGIVGFIGVHGVNDAAGGR